MVQFPLIPTAVTDTVKATKSKIVSATDLTDLSGVSLEKIVNTVANEAIHFAFKLAIALFVFYLGKFIINKLYKVTKAILVKRNVELSLATFILSLLKITLLFLLIIIVIGILGIETSSFIAIFASAGVAIGMALSGTLQNFAGGVLILLIKPYKVGDYIEVQGYSGSVKEIQIFYTVINTIDNKSIIIPNGSLSTGTINNFSKEEYRRVDWKISIAYGDDYKVAKEVALKILHADKRVVKKYIEDDKAKRSKAAEEIEAQNTPQPIFEPEDEKKAGFIRRLLHIKHKAKNKAIELKKPFSEEIALHTKKVNREPFAALGELAGSSINIVIRAWTRSEFYWDLYYDVNEKIYTEFPKAGLSFPFPQMDVHISQN